MKKILDVGYGKDTLHERYVKGLVSSRLLYGMEEIRKRGNYSVEECSLSDHKGIWGLIYNNICVLKSSDYIFMSYIYISPLLLLALFKKIGLFKRKKIVGISHTTIREKSGWIQNKLGMLVYGIFDKILFHSIKNMDESILLGNVQPSKALFFNWGDDLDFVDSNFPDKHFSNFFLSTGRENRNYKILIEAFQNEEFQLQIYTNKSINENNYDYLESMIGLYPNILISLVDKSNETTLSLARKTAECCCVVIPLIQDKINYCLGLTSIVEAMAYGKPIISSENPYSPVDIEKERIGFVVKNIEEWKHAIRYIYENHQEALEMGKRARKLAEDIYNINNCSIQIEKVFDDL